MTTDPVSHPPIKGGAFLVAPRRRHRSWFHRRRASRRGRFELALIGGGTIALLLAAFLPGSSTGRALVLLVAAGLAMTVVARMVGLAPALAAAVFAPLVMALTDPMWTLGATLADFTLAEESEAAFVTFLAASVLGSAMRHWHLRASPRPVPPLWSATPRTTPSTQSIVNEP